MKYTTNYNLKKIELTDAPPDITQLNSNFDTIDDELAVHVERLDAQEVREGDIWASINALGDKVITPFCVNSGVLDSNGQPSILSYANDNSTSAELAFQQPVLTANGTLGGSTFAVTANQNTASAYLPFSGSGTGITSTSTPSTASPFEITIYNPVAVKLSDISMQNPANSTNVWSTMVLYGSNSNGAWTEISRHNNNIRTANGWGSLGVNPNAYYKYYKLSFTSNTANAVVGIQRISLSGTYISVHTGGRVIFSGSVVATTATGKTFTVASMADVDVSKLTGREFIAFIDTAGATGVTAGTMYAQETAPTSPASGDIWFKILEPLACYQYLAGTWRERNIVPIGEVYADGAGKITGVSTYPYNQNGYTVNTRTQATPTTFGLVRTAAPEDETNCQCDDAAVTPGNLYKLADYRRANTAYEIGDVVACPYHADLMLKCTTAGTTNAGALDTTNVTEGQALADGSVSWKVCAWSTLESVYAEPFWYRNRGTGEMGDYTPSSDTVFAGVYCYGNVTIPSGVTITVPEGCLILCTGDFVNNGTISADGGALAGFVSAGGAGGSGKLVYNVNKITNGEAGAAAASEYRGTTVTKEMAQRIIKLTGDYLFGSGAGGGKGAESEEYKAGEGGSGGGSIFIVAKTITNNGTITARGTDGEWGLVTPAANAHSGGGGGGGGGTIALVADTVTINGTLSVDGGKGQASKKANGTEYLDRGMGANGEDGWIYIKELK